MDRRAAFQESWLPWLALLALVGASFAAGPTVTTWCVLLWLGWYGPMVVRSTRDAGTTVVVSMLALVSGGLSYGWEDHVHLLLIAGLVMTVACLITRGRLAQSRLSVLLTGIVAVGWCGTMLHGVGSTGGTPPHIVVWMLAGPPVAGVAVNLPYLRHFIRAIRQDGQ